MVPHTRSSTSRGRCPASNLGRLFLSPACRTSSTTTGLDRHAGGKVSQKHHIKPSEVGCGLNSLAILKVRIFQEIDQGLVLHSPSFRSGFHLHVLILDLYHGWSLMEMLGWSTVTASCKPEQRYASSAGRMQSVETQEIKRTKEPMASCMHVKQTRSHQKKRSRWHPACMSSKEGATKKKGADGILHACQANKEPKIMASCEGAIVYGSLLVTAKACIAFFC